MKKMITLLMLCLFASAICNGQSANDETVIHMVSGWSLVSVPRKQTDGNYQADHLFPGHLGVVFGYDQSTGDYKEAPTLSVGQAYWVYYLTACDVIIEGEPTTATLIATRAGWQYIGSVTQTVHRNTIQVTAGNIYGAMFWFNPEIGDYEETEWIEPGIGCMIYVTQICTIIIPSPEATVTNDKKLVSQTSYYYSQEGHDGSFDPTDPNFVTSVTYTDPSGFADVSSSQGWTVSGNVTFGAMLSAEPAVRLNAPSSDYTVLQRSVGTGDALARVDFYPNDGNGGNPHILGFDGDGYRFCVWYNPPADKFQLQIKMGSSDSYKFVKTFSLDAPPNQWYTVEIEKRSDGKCVAWVYNRGESRNYCDTAMMNGYPTSWSGSTLSALSSDGNPFYLANYYVGTYSQTTTYTDGSGRTIQTQTRDGNYDLVTPVMYDNAGRADKQWRSYRYITNHKYDGNAINTITETYEEGNSYAQAEFESSPLSRMLKQKPLGALSDTNEHITYTYGHATIQGHINTYVQTRSRANSDVPWVIHREYFNRLGWRIETTSNAEGQAEEIVDSVRYTMLGLPSRIIDPNGLATLIEYDYLGRVIKKTTPDGGTSKYAYDKAGRLRFMADAVALDSGKVLYWKYDILGRVTEKGYIDSAWADGSKWRSYAQSYPAYPVTTPATWRKQFTYGPPTLKASAGRLIKALTNDDGVSDVEVKETFSYDGDGNVTEKGLRVYEYDLNSRPTLYTYDHLGRTKQIMYPSTTEEKVTYSYDQLGRIKSIGNATIANAYANYQYNTEGRLSYEILNNNGSMLKYFNYNYDERGRIQSVGGEGAMAQLFSYSNMYNGSISSTTFYYETLSGRPPGLNDYSYTFQYDKYGRLTVADQSADNTFDIGVGTGKQTTYDKNGNIGTMRRGGVDKIYNLYVNTNRVQNTDGSGNDYVYDANGNMITASARSTPVSLMYDVFTNMTTKITETSNGFYQKYQYDARNVRVLRQNYSPSLSSTLYLHGLNDYPLVEKTSSGVERIYIYGATGLIVIKEGSSKLYVQKDHLGSTRVLYNTSGSAETIYEYDAYGKVVARKIGGNKPVYRFTGQEYEEESNLQNFRARMYDDDGIIFYATDPANQNYAPYSYCAGNPIRYTDPTGRVVHLWDEDESYNYTDLENQIKEGKIKEKDLSKNIKNTLSNLRKIGKTKGGKDVLKRLTESKENYNVRPNQDTKIDKMTNNDKSALGFFDPNKTENGYDILLRSSENKLGTVSHEIWHAYEQDMGKGGASLMSEAQAFIFEGMMSKANGENLPNIGFRDPLGLSVASASPLQSNYEKLVSRWDEKFFWNDMVYAMDNPNSFRSYEGYKNLQPYVKDQDKGDPLISKQYFSSGR